MNTKPPGTWTSRNILWSEYGHTVAAEVCLEIGDEAPIGKPWFLTIQNSGHWTTPRWFATREEAMKQAEAETGHHLTPGRPR